MTALDVLALLGLALVCLATLAATGLVLVALWRWVAGEWRRLPAEHRRSAVLTAVPLWVLMIVGAALEIIAPWGPHSYLYVIGVAGGVGLLLGTVSTAAIGVREVRREIRRVRRRR